MTDKKFTIHYTIKDDKLSIETKNDGFYPFEIIGMMQWKINDIIRQMAGDIQPDIIKRELYEREGE